MPAKTDWSAVILAAIDHLGPSTAAEIAADIEGEYATVCEQLRKMEGSGTIVTRRSAPVPAGQRGTPPKLWERPSTNGTTDSAAAVDAPASEESDLRERVASFALRVRDANQRANDMETERDRAREQKREAMTERREATARAEAAEQTLARTLEKLEEAQTAALNSDAEERIAEVEQELIDARRQVAETLEALALEVAARSEMHDELDGSRAAVTELRGLLEAEREAHEHAREELVAREAELAHHALAQGTALEPARSQPVVIADRTMPEHLVIAELDESDTRRIEFEHRVKMRERYFTLLLGLADSETAGPDVFDRLERLIDPNPDDEE